MSMTDPLPQPTLHTERLTLRPFVVEDASAVQRLAGSRLVAATVPVIPHPYLDGMAEGWIATHADAWRDRKSVSFAIERPMNDAEGPVLVGAVSLLIGPYSRQTAELGYWIGHPFWGNGYATEAAREVVRFGLEDMDLLRIHASYMAGNDASGRVLEKIGFRPEGMRPLHVERFGTHHDLHLVGILRAGADDAGRDAP